MYAPRKWRWWFHFSWLVVIAPIVYAPPLLSPRAKPPLGGHVLGTREVGPWTVTLAAANRHPPRRKGEHLEKDYAAKFCDGCLEQIKSAHIRVGKPRTLKERGGILHGGPYRLHAHVDFPHTWTGDEHIWVTVEGWNGEVHQASWPLAGDRAAKARIADATVR